MKTPRGEISDSIIALASDEAVILKMSECTSPEEVYALVKDRVGIPFEQFTAELAIAHSYLKEMESGLLTEEDLDAVAGGKYDPNKPGMLIIEAIGTGATVITIAASVGLP